MNITQLLAKEVLEGECLIGNCLPSRPKSVPSLCTDIMSHTTYKVPRLFKNAPSNPAKVYGYREVT